MGEAVSTRRKRYPRPKTPDGRPILSAVISECGTYRYELRRTWDPQRPVVEWVMLNPSTADGVTDDPTIRRCVGFAYSWGYGGIVVRNLFALRATDPAELRDHTDPVGPENEAHLGQTPSDGALTVCAWGAHGGLRNRGAAVRDLLAARGPIYHLGLTKAGHPRHPLYLPASARATWWAVQPLPDSPEAS